MESVMCSYNAVNGKPACASPELLQGTLRGAFGFEGVIVSDCGAVDSVFNLHEYTKCGCLVLPRSCLSCVARHDVSNVTVLLCSCMEMHICCSFLDCTFSAACCPVPLTSYGAEGHAAALSWCTPAAPNSKYRSLA